VPLISLRFKYRHCAHCCAVHAAICQFVRDVWPYVTCSVNNMKSSSS